MRTHLRRERRDHVVPFDAPDRLHNHRRRHDNSSAPLTTRDRLLSENEHLVGVNAVLATPEVLENPVALLLALPASIGVRAVSVVIAVLAERLEVALFRKGFPDGRAKGGEAFSGGRRGVVGRAEGAAGCGETEVVVNAKDGRIDYGVDAVAGG